jgi:hypothetical protein
MKRFILFFTALTVAASFCAHAAITVTTDISTTAWNAREADPLTAVFTANSTVGSAGGVTSSATLVQTFTLGSAIFAESFHIRYRQGGLLGLAVFEVADANAATLSLANQVWSGSATLPNPGGTTTWFANLTLDTPVPLAWGAYAFQITTADAPTFEWRRTTTTALGNTYAGGRAYATGEVVGGGTNFNNGSSEFSFAVVSVIPEPSSSALLAGMMLLGFTALRRRHN